MEKQVRIISGLFFHTAEAFPGITRRFHCEITSGEGGGRPDNSIAEEAKARGIEVALAGDAIEPRRIYQAIFFASYVASPAHL